MPSVPHILALEKGYFSIINIIILEANNALSKTLSFIPLACVNLEHFTETQSNADTRNNNNSLEPPERPLLETCSGQRDFFCVKITAFALSVHSDATSSEPQKVTGSFVEQHEQENTFSLPCCATGKCSETRAPSRSKATIASL